MLTLAIDLALESDLHHPCTMALHDIYSSSFILGVGEDSGRVSDTAVTLVFSCLGEAL